MVYDDRTGQGKLPQELVTDNALLKRKYESEELGGKFPLMYTSTSSGEIGILGARMAGSLSKEGDDASPRPPNLSFGGTHLESRGQWLMQPGQTVVAGAGGTGTGSIAVSTRPDFPGWRVAIDPGTANSKINVDRTVTGGLSMASTDVAWLLIDVPAWAVGMEATLYLSSVTNWSKFGYAGFSANQLQEGINEIPLLASDFTMSGGEVWPFTPAVARLQVKNTSGAGGEIFLGGIRVAKSMPMLQIAIDDGYADLVRYAYPILAKNGLRGVAYVVTGWIDQQDAGTFIDNTMARWRDLKMLYDAGWDICPHTSGHKNALSYSEVGTIASGGTAATFTSGGTSGDVTSNFVSGGRLVFDKPRGLALWSTGNDTSKLCTITGTVNGSPVVENISMRNATFSVSRYEWSSIDSVVMGAASAGAVTLRACYNAADYTEDVSIARARIIEMGMPRAAHWFAWPSGEFSKPIRDGLLSAGFYIRGTVEWYTGNIFGGRFGARDFPSYSAGGARTLANLQTFVGKLQAVGGIGSFFEHHINPDVGTPINTTPTDFAAKIEWLAAQCYAGALRCPTNTDLERSWRESYA
jgi:hypothetical protein